MMTWMALIEKLTGGSIRLFVFLVCTDRLTGKKEPERAWVVQGFLGVWVLAGFAWLTGLPEFPQAVLETAWFFFCVGRRKRADFDRRLCLFFSIFYESAVLMWQFLLSAAFGILFRSEEFLLDGRAERLCVLGLFDLCFLGLAWYMRRRWEEPGRSGYQTASYVVIAGFLLTVTVSAQSVIRIPEEEMSVWEIQSVILLMALLVYRLRRQYDAEREIAELKAEQAALLERDYRALNRTYETHAKLFHDFRNHMSMLQQLLGRGDCKGAMGYLEQLNGPLRELTDQVFTGDGTVDYLIGQKLTEAREQDIALTLQVEYPRNAGIGSADLNAVLGNLLDNALEAAGSIPEPEKRWISLTIRRIHQMVVIKVENPCQAPPATENGRILSSKKEQGLHGWGIQSVRTAAEKYDGAIQTVCEGEVFRAVATLSLRPAEKQNEREDT